jgi:hypothetical protein
MNVKKTPDFDAGAIVAMATQKPMTDEIMAACNAPFPDDTFAILKPNNFTTV